MRPILYAMLGGTAVPRTWVGTRRRRRQHGMALLSALMLMLVAALLAVAGAGLASSALDAARQERDRVLAQAGAEAALHDAQRDIDQATDARAAWLAAAAAPPPLGPSGGQGVSGSTAAAGGDGACGRDDATLGVCPVAVPPAWQVLDLTAPDTAGLARYGQFTGARLASGGPLFPVRLPAYLIEPMALAPGAPEGARLFRLTAIGFGTRATTRVVLQALYRKAPQSTGRIGWREIGNWIELHAQVGDRR